MIKLQEQPITIDEMRDWAIEVKENASTSKKKMGENKTIEYYNVVAAFDIEATNLYQTLRVDKKIKTAKGYKIIPSTQKIPIASTMYIWQLGIEGKVTYGRTWKEFKNLIEDLVEIFETSENLRLAIYIHNMSYEWAFIHYLFDWVDLFAMETRKPVRACTKNGIEFRCSYVLAGASLDYVGKTLALYNIKKLSGDDFNYDKKRGTTTTITDEELAYCIHDVLVVMAYVAEALETENTNIAHIRLTKTGRVRNFLKKHCLYNKYSAKSYREDMLKLKITSEMEYNYIKASYAGGFTHSNRHRTNKTIVSSIDGRIDSYDLTSSYPAALCAFRYPSKALGMSNRDFTVEEILDLEVNRYAAVFAIRLKNVHSISYSDTPLSISKCINAKGVIDNNGRVLAAKEITTIITNIDLEILTWFYEWDNDSVEIYNVFLYECTYLPHNFLYCVLSLYKDKTELKGVKGKTEEETSLIMSKYTKKKEDVNAVYGDTSLDPVRALIEYCDGNWTETQGNISEVLEKYNESKSRYNAFVWSTFCTAFARRNVLSAIHYIDEYCKKHGMHSDYIYSDTDSIKLTNHHRYKEFFDSYNKEIVAKIKACLRFRNIDDSMAEPEAANGKKKPLGVWDWESKEQNITRFKTLGAKRYMYEDEEGIHITIAGVNKKKGSAYMTEHADTAFDDFTFGLTLDEEVCGRLVAYYIDEERKGTFIDYEGNEQEYDEMSCVVLVGSDFTIQHNSIYEGILAMNERWSVMKD